MISEGLFNLIDTGHEMYKISSSKHKISVGKIIEKISRPYGNALVVRLSNGKEECVFYLNAIGDGNDKDPGWYLLV